MDDELLNADFSDILNGDKIDVYDRSDVTNALINCYVTVIGDP